MSGFVSHFGGNSCRNIQNAWNC